VPDIYLGGKLHEVELTNGNKAWAFGSSQYVQAAVANVETYLGEQNLILPAMKSCPLICQSQEVLVSQCMPLLMLTTPLTL
jgi:hypothetical protein